MTTNEILGLLVGGYDFPKKMTIRGYLKELLVTLWNEAENFSGKRPFGNSDWQYDLYIPLIRAKIIKGKLDEDGYVEECDTEAGDKIIKKCIKSL